MKEPFRVHVRHVGNCLPVFICLDKIRQASIRLLPPSVLYLEYVHKELKRRDTAASEAHSPGTCLSKSLHQLIKIVAVLGGRHTCFLCPILAVKQSTRGKSEWTWSSIYLAIDRHILPEQGWIASQVGVVVARAAAQIGRQIGEGSLLDCLVQ